MEDQSDDEARTCIHLIEQIQEILEEYFTEEAPFEDFINEIESYARCQVLNAIQQSGKSSPLYPFQPSNIKSVEIEDVGEVMLKELPTNRKRAPDEEGEKVDLPERKLIKFIKNPMERLNAILDLESKVPTVDNIGITSNLPKIVIKLEMTLGAYDFVRQCLKPIRLCLDNHFDGDKEKFVKYWTKDQLKSKFSFTNFYSSCTGLEEGSHGDVPFVIVKETSSPQPPKISKVAISESDDEEPLADFVMSNTIQTFNQYKKTPTIDSIKPPVYSTSPYFAKSASNVSIESTTNLNSNQNSTGSVNNSASSSIMPKKPRITGDPARSYYSPSNPNKKFIPVTIPVKPAKSVKKVAVKPSNIKIVVSDDSDMDQIPKKRKLIKKSDNKKRKLIISQDSPDPLTTHGKNAILPSTKAITSNPPSTQVLREAMTHAHVPEPDLVELSSESTGSGEGEGIVHHEVTLFLNSSSTTEGELIDSLQCTKEHVSFIISTRPLASFDEWILKSASVSGLVKVLKRYEVILLDMRHVDKIIQHCDFVAKEMKEVMDGWELSKGTGEPATSKYECLVSQPSVLNPQFTLKGYQLTGISWMLMLYDKSLGGILADEMGLGKTAQVVCFLGVLLDRGELGPHLIIVPSSTLDNWMREIKMWCPSLQAIAYEGSIEERRLLKYDIEGDVNLNVIVTTYNIATGNSEDRKFLRGLKTKTLFLDEGHMIKNDNSQRTKHLKNMGAGLKILITGTPLQNNLMELLSLLTFIMPNLFLPAYQNFSAIFDLKNSNNHLDDEVSKRRLERAAKIMHPFVLRRRKEDVLNDIPPKTKEIVYCPMTASQKSVYYEIMRVSKKQYIQAADSENTGRKKKTKKEVQKTNNTLTNVMMQLRKAANHQLLSRTLYKDESLPAIAKDIMKEPDFMESTPSYVVEDMSVMSDFQLHTLFSEYPKVHKYKLKEQDWMDSGKIKVLTNMLPDLIAKGDKVLIFSQFVIMLDILELIMKTLNITFLRLDGSTPGKERLGLIDLYNGSADIPVFLLSTKACGLGINLTSANVVILYDIDFNPHNDAQAEDRAHRVGQTRPVTIYKFILEGSIEQHMLTCANFKLLLDNKVQERDGASNEILPASEMANEEKLLDLIRNDIMKE